MVNVTNRADVDVRLSTNELFLSHGGPPLVSSPEDAENPMTRGDYYPTVERVERMEPMTGFEPMTSSLPRRRSTTELLGGWRSGKRGSNRDPQLGRLMLYQQWI